MKIIIILIINEKGEQSACILPLDHYQSIRKHYDSDCRIKFRKFLNEFFEHRGVVNDWHVVENFDMIL